MAPFRWPSISNDLMLAKEVASKKPSSHNDWDDIAAILSKEFTKNERQVTLTGRGVRERLERLIKKFREEDRKSLKRSGTEEEYTELQQLLEDISTYRRDQEEIKQRDKENKKKKQREDVQKGLEMREAALSGMRKRKHTAIASDNENSSSSDDVDDNDDSDDDDVFNNSKKKGKGPKKTTRKRLTKLTALELLSDKYQQKADLKEKELELKRMEIEFQKKKFETEAREREEKLQLELDERKLMIAFLKNKM